MRQLVGIAALMGLFALSVNTTAAPPEVRCRVSGAYIKIYGKTPLEQQEICERQGGELADYTPPEVTGGPPRSGVQSDMGRSRAGAGSLFK